MVNFLNENNKQLAKKIEELKTMEEKNIALLALSFQIFKLVTTKENITGTIDPLYISLVRDIAYNINELVVVDVEQVCNYANKFLELKNFRFDSHLDSSNNVGELFGVDKILGDLLVKTWNENFKLFKEVSDLYYISEIYDSAVKTLDNKAKSNEDSAPGILMPDRG